MRFLAIDFETANDDRGSACAVGLVLTDGSHVLEQHYALIKPPTQDFKLTHVHGIAWDHVADQKDFAALWPQIQPLMAKADVFVAHNASYAREVLDRALDHAKIKQPERPFVCTQKLSKRTWQLPSYKLKDLALHFGIPIETSNALSEALACARVLGRALAGGARLEDGLINYVRIPDVPRPTVTLAADVPLPPRRVPVSAAAWVIAVLTGLLVLALP